MSSLQMPLLQLNSSQNKKGTVEGEGVRRMTELGGTVSGIVVETSAVVVVISMSGTDEVWSGKMGTSDSLMLMISVSNGINTSAEVVIGAMRILVSEKSINEELDNSILDEERGLNELKKVMMESELGSLSDPGKITLVATTLGMIVNVAKLVSRVLVASVSEIGVNPDPDPDPNSVVTEKSRPGTEVESRKKESMKLVISTDSKLEGSSILAVPLNCGNGVDSTS